MLPRRSGFTLLETALATVVIGVGIVALVHAMGAGSRVNGEGQDLTQATFLAQELREWTVRLPYVDPDPVDAGKPPGPDGTSPLVFVDDLDDLMNVTYSPPRDGQGQPISSMNGWSQTIQVRYRDPNSLTTVVPDRTDVAGVEVAISRNGTPVTSTNWLVTRRGP